MRCLIILLFVTGCATRPAPHILMDPPDCRFSTTQTAGLTRAIAAYDATHDTDTEYLGQLKNNLWSLRSGCANMRDS